MLYNLYLYTFLINFILYEYLIYIIFEIQFYYHKHKISKYAN